MRILGLNNRGAWLAAMKMYGQDVAKHAVILNALGRSEDDDKSPSPPTLYRFSREFAEELSKVDLPTIPLSQLPKLFEGCFEFLDNWIWLTLNRTQRVRTSKGEIGDGVLAAFILSKSGETAYFGTPIGGEFSTVDSILTIMGEYPKTLLSREEDKDKLQWAINALVYVATGSPDLREYQPPTKESHPSRKERDRIIQESGNDPCILVSWGWKKPRRLIASQWEVSGHFWWAPVGEGRLLRELRWREGHTKSHKA